MTAKFSSRIQPFKLGMGLWQLGVPVQRSKDGRAFDGARHRNDVNRGLPVPKECLVVPKECAEIINAWHSARRATTHHATTDHPEWAQLSEQTVLRIAADAYAAARGLKLEAPATASLK